LITGQGKGEVGGSHEDFSPSMDQSEPTLTMAPYRMDDIWTEKKKPFFSHSKWGQLTTHVNHGGYLCPNRPHTSTYIEATKCLTYIHTYMEENTILSPLCQGWTLSSVAQGMQ